MAVRPWLGLALIWSPLAIFGVTRALVRLPPRVPMKFDASWHPISWGTVEHSMQLMVGVLAFLVIVSSAMYGLVLVKKPASALSASIALGVGVGIVSTALAWILTKQGV